MLYVQIREEKDRFLLSQNRTHDLVRINYETRKTDNHLDRCYRFLNVHVVIPIFNKRM